MGIIEKNDEFIANTYQRFKINLVRGEGSHVFDENGKEWTIYELWNENECAEYRRNGDVFQPYNVFTMDFAGQTVPTNILKHDFGCVPFVPFGNIATNQTI